MPITKDMVITLEYTITGQKGELIESSVGRGAPIKFIIGRGMLVPGLDARLVQMDMGEEKEFDLPPEEAFGTVDSGPTMTMSKREFPKDATFEIGRRFQAEMAGGIGNVSFEIVEDRLNDVLVRFIHPLAGKTIHMKVKVLDTRPATAKELENGVVE